MINWTPYLQSICKKYAQPCEFYTITDVEEKTRLRKTGPLLQDFWVQEIKREREEKRERFTVLEGLRKYADNHVLLRGRPGSGKSTSLARLLLEESEANLGTLPQPLSYKERGVQYQLSATSEKFKEVEPPPASGGLRGVKIPILIELRFYETSIFDLILQFLQRHELSIDKNDLENLLLGNHDFTLLLLFDGINELPADPARQDLQKFRQQYHKIPMIFTTRDIGIGGDLNIEKKLEMLPLNKSQMRDFVNNYLLEKGEQMLKQLGGRLREFGETPLLLWMLCSVFNGNNNQIPANLGLFFRGFTENYGLNLKADVTTYNESRDWWRELLQVLACKMTEGDLKTEIKVAISQREAETVFREYLQGKIEYPDNCAKQWLKDLLKHHLIQLESNEQIVFRHQLIQEYYTAEALCEKLRHLSDEELQWDYLNYLKWTEPVALMLGLLDNETQAKRVVKLGLEIDLKLGARLAGEVKVELQKQTVELVLELDVPKQFKVELLGLTKSNEVVNELSQALEDSNQYVRRNAVEALLKISPEAAIPGLLKALEHSDWTVRRNAAYALGKIGSEAAVPGLVKALEDPNKNVRSNAVCALGKIGTEAAISELVKALRNSNEDVRGTATYVLGRIDSKTVIAELVKALEDSNEDVRSNAAKALGNIGSKVAIPGLVKALEDSDWYVRSNAVEALGKIGSKTAIPELVKALEDPDEYVRSNAVEDSGNIGSEAAIPELVKALENSDWYVRENAVEALGKIGSEVAMAQLIKCLKNPDFVRLNDGDTLSQ